MSGAGRSGAAGKTITRMLGTIASLPDYAASYRLRNGGQSMPVDGQALLNGL